MISITRSPKSITCPPKAEVTGSNPVGCANRKGPYIGAFSIGGLLQIRTYRAGAERRRRRGNGPPPILPASVVKAVHEDHLNSDLH